MGLARHGTRSAARPVSHGVVQQAARRRLWGRCRRQRGPADLLSVRHRLPPARLGEGRAVTPQPFVVPTGVLHINENGVRQNGSAAPPRAGSPGTSRLS
jgi:hypothetical protein